MSEEPRGMAEMRKVREQLRKQGDGPRSFLSPEEKKMQRVVFEFQRVLTASGHVCTQLDHLLDSTDPFSRAYESAEKALTETRQALQRAQNFLHQIPVADRGVGPSEAAAT